MNQQSRLLTTIKIKHKFIIIIELPALRFLIVRIFFILDF